MEQMPALSTLMSADPASGIGFGLSSSKISPLASEKTNAFIILGSGVHQNWQQRHVASMWGRDSCSWTEYEPYSISASSCSTMSSCPVGEAVSSVT